MISDVVSADARQETQEAHPPTTGWGRWAWTVSFFLFAATLVAGFLLYPFRDPVSADQFSLQITPAGTIDIVELTMAEISSEHYDIRILLTDASKPVDLEFQFQFSLTIDCPPSSSIFSCPTVHPAPKGSYGNVVDLHLQPGAEMAFEVVAPTFTFASNGLIAQAWIPYVSCPTGCTGANSKQTLVRVIYQIPDATSYDWSSGLPPGITKGHQPVWQQYPSQLTEPVLASGTNSIAQRDDAFFTLFSGVLFGLSAAFLADTVRQLLELRKRH